LYGRLGPDCASSQPQAWVLKAQRRRWRVNLRFLADKMTLAWLLFGYLGLRYIVVPVLRFIWAVITTPLEDVDEPVQRYQHHPAHQWHGQVSHEFRTGRSGVGVVVRPDVP